MPSLRVSFNHLVEARVANGGKTRHGFWKASGGSGGSVEPRRRNGDIGATENRELCRMAENGVLRGNLKKCFKK